ncbi:ComEC/Rec2 family competence protein [Adlercreutzia sp. R21]|uniref:ComEC/Rec2 family competence protein n=1 Tax=Adlercreutzia wanghongyangiae TaxID=3111451 RepID=A0ABU6IHL6_9ACTN|nr:ComEC/Rec2 family competence protein [Adlercreutzia sp. R21]MEC4175947.1 ComEC/Rec2 family competence protein [Adlercreutzia sp. R7]MEC4184069.1 ComEC/Rec2 family competence protein [Adlercreutzia sp. R21]
MRVSEHCAPPRPHLPPLLLAGLALWGGVALVFPLLRHGGAVACVAAGIGGVAAMGALAVFCFRRRAMPVRAVLALGLAASLAASAAAGVSLVGGGVLAGREAVWTCTLTTDARASSFGAWAEARAESSLGAVPVRLNLPAEGTSLMQGERLTVRGALAPPPEEAADYYWNAGLAGSLSLGELSDEAERADAAPLLGLRRRAVELLGAHGGAEAPLLQALVCGWRGPLDETGAYEQFKRVGLAHLVAVSGAHLSIVTLFVTAGLRLIGLGRRPQVVVIGLFLMGYVGFTGMPVSAVRAALMAATGLLSLVVDRRSSALSALGLCLVLFGGVDASGLLAPSFVLSAGSTLGIVLLAPLFQGRALRGGCSRRLRGAVAGPLALTGASAAATQPYAAALFSQVPLLAPLANIAAAPLFALACVVGFAAAAFSCIVPCAAPAAVGAAALATVPLSGAVQLLASWPGTCLAVDAAAAPMVCLSVLLVGALWAWWPAQARQWAAAAGVAAVVVLAVVLVRPAPGDEIVMLDVGQGDAFLVRSQGAAVLVDTGNRDALLKEACARQEVRTLDRVAITHPDDDHCGSLSALADVAAVGGVLVADDLLSCSCSSCIDLLGDARQAGYPDGVQGLRVGDAVRCGRFTLTVVWPASFADEGGNADSLTFLCAYDGDGDGDVEWTALLCGDAEAEQLDAMEGLLPAAGVDVLKVGHHGSRKSLDGHLVDRLDPEIALVSVGKGNRYGHPAPEVCALLEEGGARVLRTDQAGDVTVAFSMEKLEVRTQRDAAAA